MKSSTVRYALRTSRADQLWLPAAFWILFTVLVWIMRDQRPLEAGRAFLGFVLPLIGGILAAYAVLDDPGLELHFAAPRPAWRMLLERIGVILVAVTVTALAYQVVLAILHVDVSPLGGLASRQLAWFLPTLALSAFGAAAAFLTAQTVSGAMLVGLVWIIQLMLRHWFVGNPVARFTLLFMGVGYPENPALRLNQACLLGLAMLLLWVASVLLKRQERYL